MTRDVISPPNYSRAKADPKIHKLLEIIGSVLDDMDRAEAWLRKEGGYLDWTVASPGALNKKPVTGEWGWRMEFFVAVTVHL